MLKAFTRFITNAVLENKRKEAHTVVATYADAVSSLVPVAIAGYQAAAHSLVDKTFENPAVLLNLGLALRAAVEHYGPDIQLLSERLGPNMVLDNTAVGDKIDAFNKALLAMQAAREPVSA